MWLSTTLATTLDTGVVITAEEASGGVGRSNPIEMLPGPLDHFDFSDIPSPQDANVPMRVTLTAQDAFGYTVTDFEDTVLLSAQEDPATASAVPVVPAVTSPFVAGVWSGYVMVPQEAFDVVLVADDGTDFPGGRACARGGARRH